MKSIKFKERIAIGLYIIAIFLMCYSLFQRSLGTDNGFIEISSWIALLVASLYYLWFWNQKKKLDNRGL